VNLAIEQLYESALVQEGLHPNPAEMLPRIQKLMALAAANAAA
jgi:molecular chaperone HtpG